MFRFTFFPKSIRYPILVLFSLFASICNIRAEVFDRNALSGLYGADPIDAAQLEGFESASLTRAYIPQAVDLVALMPPVATQKHGSCVSFSVGYAARGYYSALEYGVKPGDPSRTMSAAFLHSRLIDDRSNCESRGSSIFKALSYLEKYGALNMSLIDNDRVCSIEANNSSVPPPNEFTIAKGVGIYARIRANAKNPDNRVLDTIKQTLAAGHPVVVQFGLFRAYPDKEKEDTTLELLASDEIYRGSLAPNYGEADAGHAMVFVGYDERRQAFRVQNSWGEYWSDGGYGWIGYDATKADMHGAAYLVAGAPPPKPVNNYPKRQQKSIMPEGSCSFVGLEIGNPGKLTGFVQSEAELLALRLDPSFRTFESQVVVRPWPICEALLTLDEPVRAPSRPRIVAHGARDVVRFGEEMGVSVTTPDFPSFLYLVYLQADGTVVNLLPRRGALRKQMPPSTTLHFGDGKDGRQTFRAAAPAGSEAIIAIASRSPLLQLEELETSDNGQFRLLASSPSNEENPQDRLYLSVLRAAMAERPAVDMIGREITADVLHITVKEN